MLKAAILQQAATRHARFHLEKLEIANTLYLRGGDHTRIALEQFDRYRAQIVHAHQWATSQTNQPEASAIAAQFLITGQQILFAHLPMPERVAWLLAGIAAAERSNALTTAINYLCELAQTYLVAKDLNECIAIYTRAYDLSRNIDHPPGEARALIGLGRAQSLSRATVDSAREHLQSAIAICERIGDRVEAGWALQNLATLEERYGDIDHALELAKQALSIFEAENAPRHIANALKRIGAILERLERFDDALDYLERALHYARELDDPQIICNTYQVIGLIYSYQERMAESREAFMESLTIAEQAGFQSDAALSHVNLGWICKTMNEWDDAINHYQAALNIYERINYQTRYFAVLGNLALISVLRGDRPSARIAFVRLLQAGVDGGIETAQATGTLGLAHLSYLDGDWHGLAEVIVCLENSVIRRDYDVDEYWQYLHGELRNRLDEATWAAFVANARIRPLDAIVTDHLKSR